jgi:dTDP-4-amino-4,6-dideoxygalactose transaminase
MLGALRGGGGGAPGPPPRAERMCERLVTLPLYPTMTSTDQDDVVTALQRIQAWAATGAAAS